VCVIIDVNCMPSVLKRSAPDHARFAPILGWLNSRVGRIIYGGTKYKSELKNMTECLGLIANFERQGKLIRLSDAEVDRFALWAKRQVRARNFDDEHLVAIVALSECRVVCTDDKRAIPYLKRKAFYEAGARMPKIYNKRRHANLCCQDNIAPICRSIP
jgi:hypothetical protein